MASLEDLGLAPADLSEASQSGLTAGEVAEVCHLFRVRAANIMNECGEALIMEDVDILLRQLRIFLPTRFLWALFQEIDKNANGKVEIGEFITMVAKLRGRRKMSPRFYLTSLSRATKERYTKMFEIMSGDDKMLDNTELTTACRQLNPSCDTDSEEFRKSLEELNPVTSSRTRYGLTDFLVLQAKLTKPTPEIDVALLSLTDDEYGNFSAFYSNWRKASQANTSPHELRIVLHQLGHNMPLEQVCRTMLSAELDGTRPITLREFLYILITLGAGTNDKRRRILLPGASYEDAFKQGFGLDVLWDLGYEDLNQIRQAGWSAQSVVKAGLGEPFQLRQVGYGAAELRKLGWSPKQLKLAGFSLEELRNAGFSCASLRECVTGLVKNRAHRTTQDTPLTLRPPEHVPPGPHPLGPIFDNGGQQGERRWWATPRIKTMLDGPAGAKGTPGPNRSTVRVRPVTR